MARQETRESTETPEAKRRALLTMLQGKALTKLSRAYALFVPRLWLRLYGWEVDGKVWVKVTVEVDKITISPIDQQEAKKLMGVNDVTIKD